MYLVTEDCTRIINLDQSVEVFYDNGFIKYKGPGSNDYGTIIASSPKDSDDEEDYGKRFICVLADFILDSNKGRNIVSVSDIEGAILDTYDIGAPHYTSTKKC